MRSGADFKIDVRARQVEVCEERFAHRLVVMLACMHQKNGRWLVYDVIIEGVSLVSNYRTQFNKVIQTESYDALVQRLRAKDSGEASASPGGRARREHER